METYKDEPSNSNSEQDLGVEIGINEGDSRRGVTSLTVMIGSWDSEAEINTDYGYHSLGLEEGSALEGSQSTSFTGTSLLTGVAEEPEEEEEGGEDVIEGDPESPEDLPGDEEEGLEVDSVVQPLEQAPREDQEGPLPLDASKPPVKRRMVSFNADIPDDDEGEEDDQFPMEQEQFLQEDLSDESEGAETIDFLLDPLEEMTWGRRIALSMMHKYSWYNPYLGKEMDFQKDSQDDFSYASSDRGLKKSSLKRSKRHLVETTEKEIPSLEKAWTFFEHITLPRYLYNEKADAATQERCLVRTCRDLLFLSGKTKETFPMSIMGERHLATRLYDPKITPVSQMGNFGLGVGLYFSTLRALMFLTFICGLMSIPNFVFYSSAEYSQEQPNVSTLLKGSAICTNTKWVPCPDCGTDVVTALNTISAAHLLAFAAKPPVGRDDMDLQRTGFVVANVTSENEDGSSTKSSQFLFFALRNLCTGATIENGMVSFGTLLLFVFGMIVLNVYLANVEISLIEEMQRASNYAIMISNPPADARDPEEWKQFFEEAFEDAHVTTCTVAVDNDLLVKTLVERRECMKALKSQLPPGTRLDTLTLARVSAESERNRKGFEKMIIPFFPGVPELYGRVASLNIKCQGLAQLNHDAKKVYVVFEKEASQREAMKALTVGHLQTKRNDTSALKDPKFLFRGKHVLRVKQPDEPSSIRWQDMNAPYRLRVKQQTTTFLLTGGSIAGIAVIITTLSNIEPLYGTAAIATANVCFPEVAKWVVSRYEAHRTAEDKQVSLYFKISASRIVNTSILLTIITPFTRTLNNDDGLIYLVYSQFLAEIVSANFLQLTDMWENFKRHCIAPRMPSQDGMNLQMKGYPMELAERYTNITKLVCLCVWYYSIFPAAFFLCSLSLYINIYVDKFAVMRCWKRAPKLGTKLSRVSRRFVFTWMVVVMIVVSGFFYAGFPFDQLCQTEGETIDSSYVGEWEITTIESTLNENQAWWLGYWNSEEEDQTIHVVVNEGDPAFHVCPQSFLRGFWEEGESFFSEDQQTLVYVYGYASCFLCAGLLLWWFLSFLASFRGLFRGRYKEPKRRDRGISFSDVDLISTYIPQVKSTYFSYPLLVCDVEQVKDETLFSWNDPDCFYEDYDLTKDAKKLIHGLDLGEKVVFSQIGHWPPIRDENFVMGDESEFLEHDVLGETFATVVAPALKSLKLTSTATKVAAKTSAMAAKTSAVAAKSATKVAAKTTKAATKATAKASAHAAAATTKATMKGMNATTKATMKGVNATAKGTMKGMNATAKGTMKGMNATTKATMKGMNATTKATMKGVNVTTKVTASAAKFTGKTALKTTSQMAKTSGKLAGKTGKLAGKSASFATNATAGSLSAASSLAKKSGKMTTSLARSTAKSTRNVAGKSFKAASSVARMDAAKSSRNFLTKSMRSMGSFSDDDMDDSDMESVADESEDEEEEVERLTLLPGEAF
ncbi:protease [Seminavis robusta]|uniref:Protease n=1 Tax=Seminavis robusta TaxID=568900 RepID=A0A9N8ELP7_9STRA|nr:protease [Seminavis robusta]|eukprot:Sro1363_g266330.1 protease (1464) ;mRNA; f:4253-8981